MPSSKENMEEVPYFRATNSVILNSEALVVQYHDVIRAVWFTVQRLLQYNPDMKGILLFNEIDPDDIEAQLEWYLNRPTRNFLYSVPKNIMTPTPPGWEDSVLKEVSQLVMKDLIDKTLELTPSESIRLLLGTKGMVKKLIIWDEMSLEGTEKDCKSLYPGTEGMMSVVGGSFEELLEKVPNDSTYMISDINLIPIMIKQNKLDFSSVILADYGYNKSEDGSELKIDMRTISTKHVFKFHTMSVVQFGNELPDKEEK